MTKRWPVVVSIAVLSVAGAEKRALANLNQGTFERIVRRNATGCAVMFKITDIMQNMTNGSEALKFGSTQVSTLANLRAANKTLMAGSVVLFGSPAFVTATGAATDETISDTNCGLLTAGTIVTFVGSFGPNAASLTLPNGFGDNSAVLANGSLFDLSSGSVTVSNYAGASVTVGSLPEMGTTMEMGTTIEMGTTMEMGRAEMSTDSDGGTKSGSGGCSAVQGAPIMLILPLALLLGPLALVRYARRRR